MNVYEVTTGERFATLEIDGATEIRFSAPYKNFSVENKSSAAVYVSISGDTTPNMDGVVEIESKSSFPYAHNKPNVYSVFVAGTGKISVWASNNDANPFRKTKKGGEGTQEQSNARALKFIALYNPKIFVENLEEVI